MAAAKDARESTSQSRGLSSPDISAQVEYQTSTDLSELGTDGSFNLTVASPHYTEASIVNRD